MTDEPVKLMLDAMTKHPEAVVRHTAENALTTIRQLKTTLTTRVAEQDAEVERLREALRECRRAVAGGRDEPRRTVREIVDEAIEGHARATLKAKP
jgi:hypothetical protein